MEKPKEKTTKVDTGKSGKTEKSVEKKPDLPVPKTKEDAFLDKLAKNNSIGIVEPHNLPYLKIRPAVVMEGIEGDDTTTVLPRIKLLQFTSQEVSDEIAKPGEYVNDISKKVYGNSLCMVFIYQIAERFLFNMTENRLACVSRDGKGKFGFLYDESYSDIPLAQVVLKDPYSNRVLDTAVGICSQCPYAQWQKDEQGRNYPPKCSQADTYYGVVYEEFKAIDIEKLVAGDEQENQKFISSLAGFSFSKTSLPVSKKLLHNVKFSGGCLFGRAYVLTSEKQTRDKYTYYVPVIKGIKHLSKLDIIFARGILNQISRIRPVLAGEIVENVSELPAGTPQEAPQPVQSDLDIGGKEKPDNLPDPSDGSFPAVEDMDFKL